LPTPQPVKDGALVRVVAAGFTPLDHTILSGGHPGAEAPLVLDKRTPVSSGMLASAGWLSETDLVLTRPLALVRMARGKNGCW
jgi:NADPH2:quinone reductase